MKTRTIVMAVMLALVLALPVSAANPARAAYGSVTGGVPSVLNVPEVSCRYELGETKCAQRREYVLGVGGRNPNGQIDYAREMEIRNKRLCEEKLVKDSKQKKADLAHLNPWKRGMEFQRWYARERQRCVSR